MRKKWKGTVFGAALLGMLLMAGCGETEGWKNWTQNGISVDKSGQIMYCVVDSFDKNFYDVDELTGMAVEEAAQFNGQHKSGETTPVVVEDVSQVGENAAFVRVTYRFDQDSSFSAFQGEKLIFKTLDEAMKEKQIFGGAVLFCEGNELTLDEINSGKYALKHVIVTDAKTVIETPYDILYYSHGVKLLDHNKADTSGCDDTAVLLLKK